MYASPSSSLAFAFASSKRVCSWAWSRIPASASNRSAIPARYAARGGVVLEQTEADERRECVRHHLLEAELEGQCDRLAEPVARLLEPSGPEVVAPEVVERNGGIGLVAPLQRQRLLRDLDRACVVASLRLDVPDVGEHGGEPGRHVELTEERGALLEQRARLVEVLPGRRDGADVAEQASDPDLVARRACERERRLEALTGERKVAEAERRLFR